MPPVLRTGGSRRLSPVLGLTFFAVLGGASVERASADEWAAIDAGFASPPAEFRLGQYSAHDGAPLPVQQMAAAGIGAIQLFMQSDGYLQTEEAWSRVESNLAAVRAGGLQLWMADDNGYPSGMAGGRVVEADPALEARGLIEVKLAGRGQNPFSLALPAGAEKFVFAYLYPVVSGQPDLTRPRTVTVQDNVVTGTGRSGDWTLRAFAQQVNDAGNQARSTQAQFQTTGRYPNLLNPAATEAFVSLTHAEYARRFGPLQGKVDGFYANEPNLMTSWFTNDPPTRPGEVAFLPWDASLPASFQQRHGYDLQPLLPALYGAGTDPASKLVRRHFHETVGAVLAENFSQRIADWAGQNGVRSAGHPLQEEDLLYHVVNHGDLFRFVEPMQIPAVDLPMPDRGSRWNFWMPKFLSSVAQFKNRPTVYGLLDPIIYRPEMNLTPLAEDFRRIVNMGVFSGVNQFHTYLFWHLYDPAVYRGMSEYLGRLSLALRGARNAATVGLYYPIETFQANFTPSPHFWARKDLLTPEWQELINRQGTLDATAEGLCKAGIDFNWLHGDWIRDAVIENGALVVGSHRYSTIVLPEVELMPQAVADKLDQFRQAGGQVVLVNRRPVLGDSAVEHAAVEAIFAASPTVAVADVVGQLGAVVPPDFELRVQPPAQTGPEQEFFVARFTRDGRRITYLVNNGMTALAPSLSLAGDATRRVAVYNPLDGSITARQLPGTLNIAPSSSLLVVENPATVPADEFPPDPALSVVNGNFSDRTNLTNTTSQWFGGFPAGWSGGRSSDYAVLLLNGTAYANLGELSSAGPFLPITQEVGTVEASTDVRLTFTLANLQSGSSMVGVAIYGQDRANLGNASFTNAGTFTHTVKRVAPGTPLEIAFWGVAKTPAMGLTGVRLDYAASAFRWNGGVGGVWTSGGGGWIDQSDGTAANWSNAKPVIAQFTAAAAGTNVVVAPGGVAVSDLELSGRDFGFSGGVMTMTNTRWSVAAQHTAKVANALAGSGGLEKTGEGAVVLVGSNSYSGPTVVQSGRLILDGDHTAATGDVVVHPGAALGGGGRLGGNLAFEAGAAWVFAPLSRLTVSGRVLGGFSLAQMQGLEPATPAARYRLIEGVVDNPEQFSPVGAASAQDIGNGHRAWFEVGATYVDLVVSDAPPGFEGWLQQYGLTGAAADPAAAPAGDGIANLLKYAFNLDPLRHEGTGQFPGEYRGLPYLAPVTGDYLELIYYRDPTKTDIRMVPVWTEQLSQVTGWAEVSDRQMLGAQDGIEAWRARLPLEVGSGFMRIQVESD